MYFLIALIPALLYGSVGLVTMRLGGDSRQQTVGLALGSLVVAGALALLLGLNTDPTTVVVALCAGMIVGGGIYFQIRGFHKIGVSRVMPLSTGGQLLGISLLGVFLFGEWRGTVALPVGLLGLFLVIIGVVLTTWEETSVDYDADEVFAIPYDPVPIPDTNPDGTALRLADPKTARPRAKRPDQWVAGLVDTTISTLFFIAFPIVIRYWDVDPLRSFVFQSLGFVAIAIVVTFPILTPALGKVDTRWSKYTLWAMIPGAMWGMGAVIMQFSQIKVGVAVGFSLSQLSVIISTFGAIWLLGEKRTRKEMVTIGIGVAVLVTGALLLGLAKTLDIA